MPVGTTVVVESALDFDAAPPLSATERSHLHIPDGLGRCVGPSQLVGATVEYKILEIWWRVGLLSAAAISGSQVPCTGRPFAVLHSGRHSWYADRIAGDSAFDVQTLGPSPSTFERGTILSITPRVTVTPGMYSHLGTRSALRTHSTRVVASAQNLLEPYIHYDEQIPAPPSPSTGAWRSPCAGFAR